MRLLALTTSFPLRPSSGGGVFVRRLYEHLPEEWEVDVVCPDDDQTRGAGKEDDSRIRLYPVRYAPRRWRVLAQHAGGLVPALQKAPWRIALVPALLIGLWWRSLARGRHADIIHANWAVCGAIGGATARLLGRPIVTTLRGDDVARAQRSCVDRWILHAAVRCSSAVICVSEAMAAALRARFPEKASEIYVCLNGVEDAFLRVERSAPEPGRLRVAAVGSLIRRKGYDLLLQAVALMRYRASVTVRIAGTGPELGALRALADRLGLGEQVHFVGELAPASIPAFLAHADLFVLPSRSEGRPNAVVEALAAGLPVASFDLPGIEGLVEEGVNGWRIRAEDVTALASALDAACADPEECERRGASARASMRQRRVDWRVTGECYQAVFRRVLDSRLRRA